MGYNTTLMFLNDAWHDIKKDPQKWVDSIDEAMMGHARGYDRWEAYKQTTVMQTEHADTPRVYFSHGNTLTELSAWSRQTSEKLQTPEARKRMRNKIDAARQIIDRLEEKLDREWDD